MIDEERSPFRALVHVLLSPSIPFLLQVSFMGHEKVRLKPNVCVM